MTAIQPEKSEAPPTLEQVIENDRAGAIHLFNRYPVAFTRGCGSRLWDTEGKEYLDLLMGIGVCGLGHCHPRVIAAVQEQAAELVHTSNLFYIPLQAQLAVRLHDLSGGYLSYFANSGSEANETAVKLARKWGNSQGLKRPGIITALNSFHGRTIGMISATGQDKVKHGFEPLLPGFKHVPYNDIDALADAVEPDTGAVMIEVLQAESYNILASPGYLEAVRQLCDDRGLLLIFDEVQTGIARSGEWFGWQHYGVRPDIFTLAKALGNGIPISACLAIPSVAAAFQPGDHGGTYGGNPLACAAALAVLRTIEEENIRDSVKSAGARFMAGLGAMEQSNPLIKEVRGLGLLIGIELSKPLARDVVSKSLRSGLVINATSDTLVRLRPALTITPAETDRGLEMLQAALATAAAD